MGRLVSGRSSSARVCHETSAPRISDPAGRGRSVPKNSATTPQQGPAPRTRTQCGPATRPGNSANSVRQLGPPTRSAKSVRQLRLRQRTPPRTTLKSSPAPTPDNRIGSRLWDWRQQLRAPPTPLRQHRSANTAPPTRSANSLRQVTVDVKPARKLPAVASRPVYQSCGDSRTPPSFCAVLARRPRNQKPIARLRSRSGAVALAFPLVPLRSPFPSYRWPINHQVDFVLFFRDPCSTRWRWLRVSLRPLHRVPEPVLLLFQDRRGTESDTTTSVW